MPQIKFTATNSPTHIPPKATDLALCSIKPHTYKERPTNTTALKYPQGLSHAATIKIDKGERVEGKGSAKENPTGRGEMPIFVRIFFFPLSQEGVPSHRRDIVCPKAEPPIAQLENKFSAPPLAGASPLPEAARCTLRVHSRVANAPQKHAAPVQGANSPARARHKIPRARSGAEAPARAANISRAEYGAPHQANSPARIYSSLSGSTGAKSPKSAAPSTEQ